MVNIENSDHSESKFKIYRGRMKKEGRTLRPRCPLCDTALSQKWVRCSGCNAQIEWLVVPEDS